MTGKYQHITLFLFLCFFLFSGLYSQDTTGIIIRSIEIKGNKRTKEKIIQRELTFQVNDTLNSQEFEDALVQSRKNLLNISLFNFVTIEKLIENRRAAIYILVEERWYLWPSVIFDNADRNISTLLKEQNWDRLDYGFRLRQENFRGRNEIVRLEMTLGYNEKMLLTYDNISLDKKQQHFIGFEQNYLQNDQVFYAVRDNQTVSFSPVSGSAIEAFKSTFKYLYRKQLYTRHYFFVDYKQVRINDSILLLDNNFLGNGKNNIRFFYITYKYIHDKRDSRYYPLKGFVFDVEVKKTGLGIFSSSPDIFLVRSRFNKYFRISDRMHFANGNYGLKTFARDYPFYYERGLGYHDNFIRGFEYYVIDGNDYFMTKNTLKYTLLPTRIIKLNFLPLSKFNKIHLALHLNLSGDWGYVHSPDDTYRINNNYMVNTPLYSLSSGLDIVTYYDNVFSFNYAVNKFGVSGFYFHVMAPVN